jgi:hypothetical protein
MTPEEAIKIVESKARGRTRYEGQAPFMDEVLVNKLLQLAKRWETLQQTCQRRVDELQRGPTDEYEDGSLSAYRSVLRQMDRLTHEG